ncbi:MAG: hypothetical protein GF411_09335 [Candidatus Lokiarchaeota archaeon]|nr:hypothetical protein [Candidatus Lokiarchaeota archaeon]
MTIIEIDEETKTSDIQDTFDFYSNEFTIDNFENIINNTEENSKSVNFTAIWAAVTIFYTVIASAVSFLLSVIGIGGTLGEIASISTAAIVSSILVGIISIICSVISFGLTCHTLTTKDDDMDRKGWLLVGSGIITIIGGLLVFASQALFIPAAVVFIADGIWYIANAIVFLIQYHGG